MRLSTGDRRDKRPVRRPATAGRDDDVGSHIVREGALLLAAVAAGFLFNVRLFDAGMPPATSAVKDVGAGR